MRHSAVRLSARCALSAVFATLALAAGPAPLRAASTTSLFTPQGDDAGTPNGDYVSDTDGLDTFYRYYIEVPPGLSRLVVQVFDPDIGRGGATEDTAGRDRDRDDGYDTQVDYELIRPNGTTAATLDNCDDNTCNDNVWQNILDSTTAQNTAAGHWELRVVMGGNNDINAFGVRAHDGTADGGGTELNVYYDSHSAVGVNPPASGTGTRSYTLYPYITSGCSAAKNDFDYDSNSGSTGSIALTRRGGGFTQNYASGALSATNAWRRDTFSGWTSDTLSIGYGLWTGVFTINTYNTPGINGNYANIFLTNFQAAANPPAANPTANAFRVYLPTDAGGAPVKPYVEQLLTHTGCATNGPNPPVVGQTSCFTVTVRVVNPTPRPIVFSAANLVTANVPGVGVVYAGTPQVSQGSVVSQPAINGTGNITWNPGSVAAGATALLAYLVRVTPTSAGQRLAATGTPASNGTRAQFVDETGNTTQGRATFLFGPLCELAVTENLLTQAVVSAVRSFAADGGVLVEWRTASEAGTAGFYLQRWDAAAHRWTRVSDHLLAAAPGAPQGGTYRLLDERTSPREPQIYRLEEVEAGGKRRIHGPFALPAAGLRYDDTIARDAAAHPATGRRGAEDASRAATVATGAIATGTDGVHLSIRRTGLYYLPVADVAAWLGMTPSTAAKRIVEGKLALSRDGQPAAWYPDLVAGGISSRDKTARGLFFYGTAPDSLYTTAAVYRLQGDVSGLQMQTVAAGTGAAAPGGSFAETRHVESDAFPATVLAPDPESDYWYWEFLQGGDPTFGRRTFVLDAPGVIGGGGGGGGGTLALSLQGATASGVAGEHRAMVALNDVPLGETQWTGIAPKTASFAVPAGLLAAAGNKVEITALVGDGAPFSVTYLDSFDLSYERALRAAGDGLLFTAGPARATVRGFGSSTIRLVDVQNPTRPRWITGATAEPAPPGEAGFRISFTPLAGGRYLAAGPAGLLAPATVRPWSAPVLRAAGNRADYLVIAPVALRAAAERLADLRRAQGLAALVVDLDQIADEFGAGTLTPHTLRAFLADAHGRWSLPPRYVALAGAGTLDYRNLLGFGDNLLPPLLIQGEGGLFPADNGLGDVDGDGLAEMAVGRLPVLSAAELDAYTDKIAAYEGADSAPWIGRVLLLADAVDRGADFTADGDRIAGQLAATYTVDRIDLSITPLAAARAQLLAELGPGGPGAAFVNYLGHGGLDRLAAGGLLTSDDVPALASGERLPVVTAMTCTINRFALPGIPALGELLVDRPAGGAAAVWGPTGLSSSGDARLLAERFYHAPGAADSTDGAAPERLGDRVLRAVREFRELGGQPALPRIYDLLGDPALRLQLPPNPAPNPQGTGE